ncbi:MAG: 16S rRNA (cytidine(1402)-2'-O)-methyltransferase [Clostridiales bacterium]|jgi:16S rRNA (cytidine1402-2'-O)-methyltransferase|nr:16S rRNA (cytidine(1402)-2'-O)-methyltransferase [Clostridiales bacterium]
MSVLYVVATPIGNMGDVSRRAIETLAACDVIACEDTRRTRGLLTHFDIRGKRLVSYHKFNEVSRADGLVGQMLDGGLSVALVCDAGTPGISDPGSRLVRSARERGVKVLSVCGPSAVAAAVSVCGFEPSGFEFIGFLPRVEKERKAVFEGVRRAARRVFVFYESPRRIAAFAERLAAELPGAEACFCADISKLHEKSYYGPVDEVALAIAADPEAALGEYTVVVQKARDASRAAPDALHADQDAPRLRAFPRGLTAEAALAEAASRLSAGPNQAIERLCAEDIGYSKNELYRASLNLKKLLGI